MSTNTESPRKPKDNKVSKESSKKPGDNKGARDSSVESPRKQKDNKANKPAGKEPSKKGIYEKENIPNGESPRKAKRSNSVETPHKQDDGSPRKGSDVTSLRGAEPKRKGAKERKRSKSPAHKFPFFEEDEFSDVSIKCGGGDKKLFSNRCLLSYSSPVFTKMLGDKSGGDKGKSKTTGNKELDLSEKRYGDVVEMLAFIDPRVEYKLKDSDAFQLLPLAEEFDIKQLKKSCEWTVTESFFRMKKGRRVGCVPTDITIKYLIVADKHDFKDLKEMCMEELVANDNPFSCKVISDSDELSEHVKRQVLEKKLDKVNLALAKERRNRTEHGQMKDTRGGTVWKK